MKKPGTFHIVVDSNSQASPLPWQHKDDTLEPEKFTTYWNTYPYIFKQRMASSMPSEVSVSVFSARGGTIRHAAGRVNDTIRWMGPDVTVLNHGVVDCWIRKGNVQKVPLAEFEQLLGNILEFKSQKNPDLLMVLLGIPHTNAKTNAALPALAGHIDAYNDVLRKRAGGMVTYLDLAPGQAEMGEDFLHPDGHHFSPQAHVWIGEQLSRITLQRS